MTASVIVATPHEAFGELLRLSLEEEGRYLVHLVESAREAADTLKDTAFNIAIIDGELKDMRVSELGRMMLSRTPGLKVVLIPPENDPRHPSLAGMVYHGYILRPFYLPDLLDMMESLSADSTQAPNPTAEASTAGALTAPPAPSARLNEKRFEQALSATSALAGVVLLGKEQSLTRGDLPEAVAVELEALVSRALSNGESTDLVRFVRLSGQQSDHLFYITRVTEDMALGLAYPVGTPLSRVRIQAGQVAEALRSMVSVPAAVEREPVQAAQPPTPAATYDPLREEVEPDEDADAEGESLRDIDLAALLGAVPSPNPGGASSAGWVPEISMSLPRPEREVFFPWDEENHGMPGNGKAQDDSAPDPQDTQPVFVASATELSTQRAVPETESTQPVLVSGETGDDSSSGLDATQPVLTPPKDSSPEGFPAAAIDLEMHDTLTLPQTEPPLNSTPDAAATQPVLAAPADRVPPERAKTAPLHAPQAAFPWEEPPVDELEDTRPRVLTNPANFQQLVPASPAFSLLSYTCVLIPRLPQHHLTGGLSGQTGQWVQQLCVAFGWRLEGIAVRPEYLQWTVQVSPSIAPANLIRILRGRISELIFENYPGLAKQNPSGDYWATGYLIVSGMQPPSPRLLRDYITETRRRQGLNYPGGEPLAHTGSETTSLLDGSQAPLRTY